MRSYLLSLGLLVSLPAYGEIGYVCVGDKGMGFVFDAARKEWGTSTQTSGDAQKLIVKRTPEQFRGAGEYRWMVFFAGSDTPISLCRSDFNESGYLSCGDSSIDFRMNRNDLRYIAAAMLGYVGAGPGGPISKADPGGPIAKAVGKEGDLAPYMIIGRCTPI